MGFEYKEYTREEFSRLSAKFKGAVYAHQSGYAVDPSRDAYFISFGTSNISRDNEAIWYANLIWKGDTIVIEAEDHFEGEIGAFTLVFAIRSLRVPVTLRDELEDIRQLIAAGVKGYKQGLLSGDFEVAVNLPATVDWT